jgi:glc operon protein GlcG
MHEQTCLSLADAQRILGAIQAELDKRGRGAAIAVADEHGELIAFARTDGCPLPSIAIAINKAFTAARERKPSRAVGEASRSEGFPMTNFGDPRYVGWGGGLPVLHRQRVIGGVGVSGLPEQEDIVLAELGLRALDQGGGVPPASSPAS